MRVLPALGQVRGRRTSSFLPAQHVRIRGLDCGGAGEEGEMLESRLVNRLQDRVRELSLPLSIRLWNGYTVSAPAPARVCVDVRTPAALTGLVRPTMGALARQSGRRRPERWRRPPSLS